MQIQPKVIVPTSYPVSNCNISRDTVPTSGWSVLLDHLLPDGIHW